MVRAAHLGRDALASRDRQVRRSSGYLCCAGLCGITASTRYCRECSRGTAARHVYRGLLAHTATPRLGRAAPDFRVSRDLKGGHSTRPLPLSGGSLAAPAQSRANLREIPWTPAGGSHLKIRSGETLGEMEANSLDETAAGVLLTVERPPCGADFGCGRDALVNLRGAWRRGWDSNPRRYRYLAGFQDRCLKPLGHLSGIPQYSSRVGARWSTCRRGLERGRHHRRVCASCDEVQQTCRLSDASGGTKLIRPASGTPE